MLRQHVCDCLGIGQLPTCCQQNGMVEKLNWVIIAILQRNDRVLRSFQAFSLEIGDPPQEEWFPAGNKEPTTLPFRTPLQFLDESLEVKEVVAGQTERIFIFALAEGVLNVD